MPQPRTNDGGDQHVHGELVQKLVAEVLLAVNSPHDIITDDEHHGPKQSVPCDGTTAKKRELLWKRENVRVYIPNNVIQYHDVNIFLS